jgi:hypothetical protein
VTVLRAPPPPPPPRGPTLSVQGSYSSLGRCSWRHLLLQAPPNNFITLCMAVHF